MIDRCTLDRNLETVIKEVGEEEMLKNMEIAFHYARKQTVDVCKVDRETVLGICHVAIKYLKLKLENELKSPPKAPSTDHPVRIISENATSMKDVKEII